MCETKWKQMHCQMCGICFKAKNNFFMFSHILSVGSVMFVGRSARHKETRAKQALNLVSPLSVTSQNFYGPGFWISIKGIWSHPQVDWPCKDFTQGSTREQPSAPAVFYPIFRLESQYRHSQFSILGIYFLVLPSRAGLILEKPVLGYLYWAYIFPYFSVEDSHKIRNQKVPQNL